jgi:hypothetical protein
MCIAGHCENRRLCDCVHSSMRAAMPPAGAPRAAAAAAPAAAMMREDYAAAVRALSALMMLGTIANAVSSSRPQHSMPPPWPAAERRLVAPAAPAAPDTPAAGAARRRPARTKPNLVMLFGARYVQWFRTVPSLVCSAARADVAARWRVHGRVARGRRMQWTTSATGMSASPATRPREHHTSISSRTVERFCPPGTRGARCALAPVRR